MLDDRSYMRGGATRRFWSATVVILAINAVIFLVQLGLPQPAALAFHKVFALSWDTLKVGMVWQLITFQFLHGGFWHILFNSVGIYMFGRSVEEALGTRKFVKLYLVSGVVGGLVHVLGSWILPHNFGGLYNGLHSPVVGASAGAYGLIAAFAALYPEREITLFLFYVLPVTLTARVLLLAAAAFAVFGIVFPRGNVAEGAHLGGLLFGWVYITTFIQNSRDILEFRWPGRRLFGGGGGSTPSSSGFWKKPAAHPGQTENFSDEFISQEVDPILDKISAHGIQSLTDRERRILEAARSKMAKR